jgi:hypothetical protein
MLDRENQNSSRQQDLQEHQIKYPRREMKQIKGDLVIPRPEVHGQDENHRE